MAQVLGTIWKLSPRQVFWALTDLKKLAKHLRNKQLKVDLNSATLRHFLTSPPIQSKKSFSLFERSLRNAGSYLAAFCRDLKIFGDGRILIFLHSILNEWENRASLKKNNNNWLFYYVSRGKIRHFSLWTCQLNIWFSSQSASNIYQVPGLAWIKYDFNKVDGYWTIFGFRLQFGIL